MLPFTKRAGRTDENAKSATLQSPAAPRAPQDSISDDDMTNIVSSKSIAHVVIPAAGRPATQPPPSLRGSGRLPPSVRPPPPPSHRPPPMSARQMDNDFEDDDNGRTAVRGAPKIVKRTNAKSGKNGQIAPASVIKATLESARANQNNGRLLAGTPSDLRDETDDRLGATETFRPAERLPFVRSAQPLPMDPAPPSVTPPTGYGPPSSQPVAHANSTNSYRPIATMPFQGMAVQGYASQPPHAHAMPAHASQPYGQAPMSARAAHAQPHAQGPFTPRSSPPSAPGSAPAHFMTPQMRGEARYNDPPGTAVTSGHRVASGRPAASWAVALLACGLFVGVAAVAVTQGSENAADTTASFVDPSRTPAKAAAMQPAAPAPLAQPQQGGVIGASPVQEPAPAASVFGSAPSAVNTAQPAAFSSPQAGAQAAASAAIPAGGVLGGFAPVAVPTPAAATTATTAKVEKADKPEPKPVAKPVWHAAPRPAAPTPRVAAANDEPKEPATKKKPAAAPDDETKKALEALQKAQLESSNSFGN